MSTKSQRVCECLLAHTECTAGLSVQKRFDLLPSHYLCVCVCFLRLGFLFSCNFIMFNFQVKLKEMGSAFH